jgi:hypothetical protein
MPASAAETSAHGGSLAADVFDPAIDPPSRAIIMRLSGIAASIASFALAFIVNVIYSNG